MTGNLLARIVVPVANEEDTEATCAAIEPHLDEGVDQVIVVHVIEQTPGYMDHTSPEALEEEGREILGVADARLDEVDVETELRFGTALVEEINAVVAERDATAIVFHPREKGRLTRLLTQDAERDLLRESRVPVVALPDAGEVE